MPETQDSQAAEINRLMRKGFHTEINRLICKGFHTEINRLIFHTEINRLICKGFHTEIKGFHTERNRLMCKGIHIYKTGQIANTCECVQRVIPLNLARYKLYYAYIELT